MEEQKRENIPHKITTKNDKGNCKPSSVAKVKIGIASTSDIFELPHGEVRNPKTINYQTRKAEREGLFCYRIFGPEEPYKCHCGRYAGFRYRGSICDRCGGEVGDPAVRRERMGYIDLISPVVHSWYHTEHSSVIAVLLNMPIQNVTKIIYDMCYVQEDAETGFLDKTHIYSYSEVSKIQEQLGENAPRMVTGGVAIQQLLEELDVEGEYEALAQENQKAEKRGKEFAPYKKRRFILLRDFMKTRKQPSDMVLEMIPVLPAGLRPITEMNNGTLLSANINNTYREIIIRNNRIATFLERKAPEIMINQERILLQRAVDALFGTRELSSKSYDKTNKGASLESKIKGKNGLFRKNLVAKRVDYSGRSIIIVGPELKLHQCGLPKTMALELFRPFLYHELLKHKDIFSTKQCAELIRKKDPVVWDAMDAILPQHVIFLNRAPTLHRLGIQAFEPVLVEGNAIQLHPLVCTAFNADFDGDQMAVHLPITVRAIEECRELMMPQQNLLKPSDGSLVAMPSQDMVLGIYYLTQGKMVDYSDDILRRVDAQELYGRTYVDPETVQVAIEGRDQLSEALEKGAIRPDTIIRYLACPEKKKYIVCTPRDILGHWFSSVNQAILAYENHDITLQQKIYVKREIVDVSGHMLASGVIETTLGRLLLNEVIPQDLGFVDRTRDLLTPEIHFHVKKTTLKQILERCIQIHGFSQTAEILDNVKSLGFKYSTKASISVSIKDMVVPEEKPELLAQAQKLVEKVEKNYRRGQTTEEERYKEIVNVWKDTDTALTEKLMEGLDKYNALFMMADSGARGSDKQIKQLAGMRGLMADTTGKTIEMPIKSNFREGLDVLEYFMSAHGARKGMSDTALRTADAGYLTRRMVSVGQDLSVCIEDCAEGLSTIPGRWVTALKEGNEIIEDLEERITGWVSCYDIYDSDGRRLVSANELITPAKARHIVADGVDGEGNRITKVKVRTVLSCKASKGVCAKCYGASLATSQMVHVGEAVGIIAAQSIGEPGAQLTMRTFHTGGVAGGDITQGLPRVEELFEVRTPKKKALIAEISGTIAYEHSKKGNGISITGSDGTRRRYTVPFDSHVLFQEGDYVQAGTFITDGNADLRQLLNVTGVERTQEYILKEVQRVYRVQGVVIADKHVEIIIRRMFSRVSITHTGDSRFFFGEEVRYAELADENKRLLEKGKELAEGKPILKGITKVSLGQQSFLAAASFQGTRNVLTEAALEGKVDELNGVSENVMMGKLINIGTGMRQPPR